MNTPRPRPFGLWRESGARVANGPHPGEGGNQAPRFFLSTLLPSGNFVLRFAPHGNTGRGYGVSHGLKIVTPAPAKSFTFRVTSVRSCSRAVAAISPSGALIVSPLS